MVLLIGRTPNQERAHARRQARLAARVAADLTDTDPAAAKLLWCWSDRWVRIIVKTDLKGRK
jgi:hypothetical protein